MTEQTDKLVDKFARAIFRRSFGSQGKSGDAWSSPAFQINVQDAYRLACQLLRIAAVHCLDKN